MSAVASKARRTREWMGVRPIWSTTIAATISFLIGMGAGASGPQARLASLTGDFTEQRAESATEIQDLQSEVDELSANNDSLQTDNEDLSQQVVLLNAEREIPKLVDGTEAFASGLEDRYGWDLVTVSRYSTAKPGTILSQDPPAGTMMRYGASYKIVVAKAPPRVPRLRGLTVGRAKDLLGTTWNVVIVEQVSTQRSGRVLSVSPGAGTGVMPGATVTLTVSKKAPPPASSSAGAGSGSGCTPGYSPCLPPASDYDCAGGSGDGPEYTGPVTVTGSDPCGLDTDGDGYGCES